MSILAVIFNAIVCSPSWIFPTSRSMLGGLDLGIDTPRESQISNSSAYKSGY